MKYWGAKRNKMEIFSAWTWICIPFLQRLSFKTAFPRKFSIFPITKDPLQKGFSLCACIQMRLFCSALSVLATHPTGSSALRGSSSTIMSHSKMCRNTGEEIAAVTAVTELGAPAGLLPGSGLGSGFALLTQALGLSGSSHFTPPTSLPTQALVTASPDTLPKSARGKKTPHDCG